MTFRNIPSVVALIIIAAVEFGFQVTVTVLGAKGGGNA